MTAILKLESITCIETAEIFGKDELYVTFGEIKTPLPSMSIGDTATLNHIYLVEGSETLNLFESDGDHWYDRDDFIASHTITEEPINLTLEFLGSDGHAADAHYQLDVSVMAF